MLLEPGSGKGAPARFLTGRTGQESGEKYDKQTGESRLGRRIGDGSTHEPDINEDDQTGKRERRQRDQNPSSPNLPASSSGEELSDVPALPQDEEGQNRRNGRTP